MGASPRCRILALLHQVPATATLARIDGLAEKGVLSRDEHNERHGACRQVMRLLLRQQFADFKAGRAIERMREKVAVEIGGRTVRAPRARRSASW